MLQSGNKRKNIVAEISCVGTNRTIATYTNIQPQKEISSIPFSLQFNLGGAGGWGGGGGGGVGGVGGGRVGGGGAGRLGSRPCEQACE
jgi:hypothetical protein